MGAATIVRTYTHSGTQLPPFIWRCLQSFWTMFWCEQARGGLSQSRAIPPIQGVAFGGCAGTGSPAPHEVNEGGGALGGRNAPPALPKDGATRPLPPH